MSAGNDMERFPRISRPVELLRHSYDVVVVGSGYGAGVAASRMARAGQDVCVLERGKERWPGEYPYKTKDVKKDLHMTGRFSANDFFKPTVETGDPTGLYHMIFGEGQSVLVGNGLGGTSLINANVFLRSDESTMSLPYWPKDLQIPGVLDSYYDLAQEVLQPMPYPENWPKVPKLSMLKRQAHELGFEENFRRPPQTTWFTDGYNSTGVHMNASKLTGQDATGVNDGSKSSTLVNYLSDAWNWGAEMFCECEVRYITRHPKGGYLVFFAWHGAKRGLFKDNLCQDLMFVHAKKCVFLGAGSLGTTEILLRSRERGMAMSDRVGKGMSGNGDMYAFGYNCDAEVNSLGKEHPDPYRPIGTTITGMIDCRSGHQNPLDGFVIQDGTAPEALAPFCQTMMDFTPRKNPQERPSIWDTMKRILAQVGSRLMGPYFKSGSIEHTQVYLVMSHDTNQGTLELKDNKPYLQFLGVGRSEHVEYLNELLAKATHSEGGTYINNPWYALAGQQELTVHPIGGACMSNDGLPAGGVTNHFGEVFTGTGNEIHAGLVVADGAAVPTSLAVNPLATITALAERSVAHAASNLGVEIDLETKNGILDLFGPPRISQKGDAGIENTKALIENAKSRGCAGFGFAELMSGFVHAGKDMSGNRKEDFQAADRIARSMSERARLFLSVRSWDIDQLTRNPDHAAMLTGTFTCSSIHGSPFTIHRGTFNLFTIDEEKSCTKNLVYDFDMVSIYGETYHFHGFKEIGSSATFNPAAFWPATSTLYATITDSSGSALARGILGIEFHDFRRQIRTMTAYGNTFASQLYSYYSFVSYFARESFKVLLSPFLQLEYPLGRPRGFRNPTTFTSTSVTAIDGVSTMLHTWEPTKSLCKVHELLMIPGAAVDHQIFSLATIPHNAVQHFTAAGYRTHVIVHRIGGVTQHPHNWTTYDARLDIHAALQHIREKQQTDKVYVIAHCMGSVAFSCGLLDGTIPPEWIKGITCSQVFMNPIWTAGNMIKIKSPVKLDSLYKSFAGEWFPCESRSSGPLAQRGIDQIMRIYPDTSNELCKNAACHRCTLVFGRCWNHSNLNEATHRQIDRFFGGVNMTCLHLLMHMGTQGHVTTNFPEAQNLVTKSNILRLKGIPFFLFSGQDSAVLTPESTGKTYETLTNILGPEGIEREVVPGYGHLDCWMGTHAYEDVYPMVLRRVDKVCRGEELESDHDEGYVHV